jgi:hypothetical protein
MVEDEELENEFFTFMDFKFGSGNLSEFWFFALVIFANFSFFRCNFSEFWFLFL